MRLRVILLGQMIVAEAYASAGYSQRFRHHPPNKPHCCDAEIQAEALDWLEQRLE